MQSEGLRGLGDGVLDQGAGHRDAAIRGILSPGCQQVFAQSVGHLSDAQARQQFQSSVVDPPDLGIGQRRILTATLTRRTRIGRCRFTQGLLVLSSLSAFFT